MRKEDIAKFKKSCEVAKSRNDNDKTSFEIRVFDYNTNNAFYKTLTKRNLLHQLKMLMEQMILEIGVN